MTTRNIAVALILAAFGALPTVAQTIPQTIDGRLARELATKAPDGLVKAWVFFDAKPGLSKLASPEALVSERSLERRRKVLPASQVVDRSDLPVDERYIDAVAKTGASIRERSRWLNAVSISATPAQLREVAALPHVVRVEPVLLGGGRRIPVAPDSDGANDVLRKETGTKLSYGSSLTQINSINAVPVHDSGNYAQGILIGVFDNGFRLLTHEAFAQMHIVATYDFVDHKVSVVPLNTTPGFGDHGVMTLSTIGGYKAGSLVGPAFGASYILCRTENDSSETPFEEDKWIAAIEWADSIGVQVTSTSLGYLTYDAPFKSWTWQDMDGRTTPITRAAAMAVRKGIIVVNSAGNEGSGPNFPHQNTLNAPADADSVLTVGALNPSGIRASFSSVGPSTSTPAHIKPDVMAQGTNIVAANPYDPQAYYAPSSGLQGTSFSCPLAAGAAALVLKAVPTATVMQIVGAMKSTASRAQNPGPANDYGWGTVNTAAAIAALGGTITLPPPVPPTFALDQNYPNPFNGISDIEFRISDASDVTLKVFDLLGREVATLVNERKGPGIYTARFDAGGLASGTYLYRLKAGSLSQTRGMTLIR